MIDVISDQPMKKKQHKNEKKKKQFSFTPVYFIPWGIINKNEAYYIYTCYK